MTNRQLFTINEVLGELDGSAEVEEESDDDFEGYVDIDDDRINREEREQGVHDNVGANVEIGAGGTDAGEDNSSENSGDDEMVNSVPTYTHEPGCSVLVEGERPLDYFSLLVTDDMLEHIVSQTNLSAQQYISTNDLAPHSRVRRWSKSTNDLCELKRFLAIIIVMGLVRYPQIEDHWATLWPFTNSHCSSVSG